MVCVCFTSETKCQPKWVTQWSLNLCILFIIETIHRFIWCFWVLLLHVQFQLNDAAVWLYPATILFLPDCQHFLMQHDVTSKLGSTWLVCCSPMGHLTKWERSVSNNNILFPSGQLCSKAARLYSWIQARPQPFHCGRFRCICGTVCAQKEMNTQWVIIHSPPGLSATL